MPELKPEERPKKSDLIEITEGKPPTKLDQAAAVLEEQLQKETDERREERFYWLTAVVILIDMLAAPSVGAAFILIFLLEIIVLIGLAHKLGIDPIVILLQRLFDKLLKKNS